MDPFSMILLTIYHPPPQADYESLSEYYPLDFIAVKNKTLQYKLLN